MSMNVCIKCGATLDNSCILGNQCKDCYIIENAEREVFGYFEDKYEFEA